MRIYAILIYIFLYAPIALIVGFSFNAGKYAMDWQGFSVEWYAKAFSNPLIMEALRTSVFIAFSTALLSAIIGTLTALGLERVSGWLRTAFDALIYVAIMVPGIVIGISTLIAFVSFFDLVNPWLTSAWSIKLEMGAWAVIAAHVLFNIAVVALLVRARLQGMDRSLVEASEDLYATPLGTFRQVVLPLLAPAILAGFLLAAVHFLERLALHVDLATHIERLGRLALKLVRDVLDRPQVGRHVLACRAIAARRTDGSSPSS